MPQTRRGQPLHRSSRANSSPPVIPAPARRSRGTRQAWIVSEEIEIEPHGEDDSNRKQNRADQRIVHGLAPLEKQEFLDDAAVNFDIYSIAAFETERSPAKAGPSMASSTVAE